MSVLQARSRIINFRLTEQEYRRLQQACSAQGWRSLSDFARTAVLNQSEFPADGSVQTHFLRIDRKLSDLDYRVFRMLQLLDPGSGIAGNGQNGKDAAG